jgi:methionyl-tRNA formyltransferase
MTVRAVVFAYHNVGVRCLRVLLAHGVDIALIVTHEDNPNETIFFASVAQLAQDYAILTIKTSTTDQDVISRAVREAAPDFIFSFYFRNMLPTSVLALAKRGALNMHGSLLPKYRGRAPTNWAVLHGETETGATLHYMVEKPDAGDIVAQTAVPILPDDTAGEVFDKVTVAAELTLHQVLPALIAGKAPRTPLIPIPGQYFGGRKPEDGRIDLTASAQTIHNLVRAVAPPYPGAFFELDGTRVMVHRTRILRPANAAYQRTQTQLSRGPQHLLLETLDGGQLAILAHQAPIDLAITSLPRIL